MTLHRTDESSRACLLPIVAALGLLLIGVAGESIFHKHYFPDNTELTRAAKIRANLNIDMSPRELAFLINGINASRGLVEFGSGGATTFSCILFRSYPDKKMFVVDSSAHYALGDLKDNKCMINATAHGAAVISLVDLGSVDQTGFPTSNAQQKNWHKYSSIVATLKSVPIDTAVVDGRFRVASVAAMMLHFPAAAVYLHDYKKYEADVEDIAEFVQHCDSLFLLKRKIGIADVYLKKKIDKFKENPN